MALKRELHVVVFYLLTAVCQGAATPLVAESPNDTSTMSNSSGNPQGGEENVERYPVVDPDFERVEDPFIISLWIFCACLGKIGEFS